MKKFNTKFLMQLLFWVASIALMLIGSIMLTASFFTPLPAFNGTVLLALGIIMLVVIKLNFMFGEILENVTEIMSKYVSLNSPQGTKNPSSIISDVITINENTTPDEIEEIKNKYPMIAAELDKILHKIEAPENLENFFSSKGIFKKDKDITSMSISELEKAMENAVKENEFEKAAEIRDEINKRK